MSTPEEQMALLNYMGMGMYGSPLMSSATSQLNLVQDIGSMAFDTVFMYNMGLITPEQLLDSIKNATREPVGDASEYDWESEYNQFIASNEEPLIQGANAIVNGTMTAAQYIRNYRSRMAEEGAYEINPDLSSTIDSLEEQLKNFETKYNNFNFIKQKVDSKEYDFDETTGMVYKPLLGEDARENLRAQGWKGPFSEPEFWRTVPDPGTMDQAAKLQQQFEPIFAAYESDNEIAESKTRAEIAKTSPAMKRFIEEKKKKGEDVSGQVVQKTKGWKAIEDAYKKAMQDFKNQPASASGFEDLGFYRGKRWVVTKRGGKEIAIAYDTNGNRVGSNENPEGIKQLRSQIAATNKYNASRPRETEVGRGGDTYIVTRNGKQYLERRGPGGTVYFSSEMEKAPHSYELPEEKANDYWAQQAAYYTAKGMGAERDKRAQQAKEAEAKVVAKEQEAMEMGKTPALEWLKMMPQLAAMAAQPAPEAPKPVYVKPKPRVLSDQEIETMANMIAGGMG